MPGNIIAVDGFSSTGKSTLASKLAKHYNFYYLNSGLMYRIISYFALNNGCIIKDKIKESQLINKLDKLNFEWLRIHYAHPAHLSRKIIQSIADANYVCSY